MVGNLRRRLAVGCVAALGLVVAACGPSTTSAVSPTTAPSSRPSAPAASTTTTVPPASTTTTTEPPLTPIPSGANLRTSDVAFFDPTVGYGVFRASTGRRCEVAVAKTTDGGAHFGPVVAVAPCNRFTSFSGGKPVTVASVAFDDHGDGFVYGTSLYVTHDGGATWHAVARPGPVLSVEALGSSVWMLGDRCPTPTCPARLLESTDGGTTWHQSPTEPAMTNHSPQLVRLGPRSAYVITAPVAARGPTGATAPLWYTADGGRTWVERSVPCHGLGVALSAAPTGKLFVACASEPGAGNQAKGVHVSTDGGASWSAPEACTTTISSSTCLDRQLLGGYLGTLVAVSATTAYLAGPRSPVYETTDGGGRWEPDLSAPAGTGSFALTFFDQNDGLVVGEAGGVFTLWHTGDAGARWTPVALPARAP